ncbi:MAG: hypothetical protein H6613_17540 [Ignavibacteriales bacterium]|nr:hypothetical protein [Ignavibacteriales bacterium]
MALVLGYSSSMLGQKALQKEEQRAKTLYEAEKVFNEKWAGYDVKNGFYMENGIKTKSQVGKYLNERNIIGNRELILKPVNS